MRVPQRIAGSGTIFEAGGEIGYRQVDSSVDGRRYVNFNVFLTATLGWRVDCRLALTTFYLLPQVGVGGDVARTRPPSRRAAAPAPGRRLAARLPPLNGPGRRGTRAHADWFSH
ncbi:hypothetical protein [Nannocystis punicea]|uniref:Uncharacterized protein n=1 Tax=Nannocystis punicea TaxID=2995304 RepID=A0ABY7GZG1_9BACT|nr:hypothetical protein [Nannocystis poenicansa]WAS92255.1 hypothetical protein O0S08_39250 [Nannocystis poenicansa]